MFLRVTLSTLIDVNSLPIFRHRCPTSRRDEASKVGLWSLALALMVVGCAGVSERAKSMPAHLIPATAEGILQAVRNSGARVVLVNVWATWCEPCREEFPDKAIGCSIKLRFQSKS